MIQKRVNRSLELLENVLFSIVLNHHTPRLRKCGDRYKEYQIFTMSLSWPDQDPA